MEPDILAAIAAYLAGSMGASLASPTGIPQAYSDYAPTANADGSTVTPPYAVVTEGPETYTAQAEDHAATGYWLSNLATGTAFISFLAPSKAGARALCRAAVRLMSDTEVRLDAADGRVVTLLPLKSETVPQAGTGVGDEPQVYHRVLTVQYMQQFVE